MCTPATPRAIALEHGHAHDHDHATWSRRDFLVRSGLTAIGGAALVGSTPIRALARSPLVEALRRVETDRVLVLVQLSGGNDGLNTVIPLGNDLYYRARPSLAISQADAVPLNGTHGFHPSMAPLRPLWDQNQLGIIQSVGYDDQTLSHFQGTDFWMSGLPQDPTARTGWAGRVLSEQYPDLDTAPPLSPPAVQLGTSAPLLFEGDAAGYGMAMLDIDVFLRLAEGGDPFPTDTLPPTAAGDRLGFVRRTANDAFRYRGSIEKALENSRNDVAYPAAKLGKELAAIARLIKGRLGSRIYLVSLGGFDTHASQSTVHSELLAELAGSLAAFYEDLGLTNDHERTLTMTFSEFGRRVEQNGSAGTDHGTSAPLFLAGPGAKGGIHGPDPNLADLDDAGNMRHHVDFRQVYSWIIESWFGLDPEVSKRILGGAFDPISNLNTVPSEPEPGGSPTVVLDPVHPNPIRGQATASFSLRTRGHARLDLFDVQGRLVLQLADGEYSAGPHPMALDASTLPAGVYVLRLTADGVTRVTRATVVR